MDNELSKTLADCLAEIEGGASVDDCLKRHPDQASELRPHLESWSVIGGAALVQPSVAALNRGRQAMRSALTSAPSGFGPLAAARMAPAWAAVVAAAVIVLGGAAGASAALGGPNVAGDALDAVGVTQGDGEGGISHSSASDRGLECANPNAFEGKANSEDKAQNAVDAQSKEKCSPGNCEAETDTDEVEEAAETDDAKGDDADDIDEDADDATDDADDADLDEEDGGNGNANGNANANANGNGNGNANANGQSNAQPCAEDGEGDGAGSGEAGDGTNNASDKGKENANENASQGAGNAEDRGNNQNDDGDVDGADADGGNGPQGQGGGQNQD